jgi:probable phosphoglycerate mutase
MSCGVNDELFPTPSHRKGWPRRLQRKGSRRLNVAKMVFCVAHLSHANVTSIAMTVQVILIRHGETAWSKSGQHTSSTDIPLTEHGEREAEELGARLRTLAIDYVWTSPRQRARRTCELAGLSPQAIVDDELAEWRYGDYEGLRTVDVIAARPGWNLFVDGCPHGETPAEISARADRVIARLRALEGSVAVFSHGHFGRALAARWIGLPVAEAEHFLLSTASLSVLGDAPATTPTPAILRWNSCPRDDACIAAGKPTISAPPRSH